MIRLILTAFLTFSLGVAANTDTVPDGCRKMVEITGMPRIKGSDRDYQLICKKGHLLAHSPNTRTPLWVLERLTSARFVGNADRTKHCRFKADPFLVEDGGISSGANGLPYAIDDDYRNKSAIQKRSFDRGHMAPAASMKWDEGAMKESCFLSNVVPQQGPGFNRAIWADLEEVVRDWACDRGSQEGEDSLVVVTGPIFEDDESDTLGHNNVAVPSSIFKVIFDLRLNRAIAFIMPNEKIVSKGKRAQDVLSRYVVSVYEVERRSGIQFFPGLNIRERNMAGANPSPMWGVVRGCEQPRYTNQNLEGGG